ncbi:NAD/NADP octopine/nopaline dehydrogenase [Cystobacter fuscus DSM 2262]|uniref:NAD/NADP octopine/nopaline dehydrogenase n=1 Tax=Cystobacter fuscus (strain ATCC 25194 / DSM 2262 / NBRC 100088 / M29) TaxID=1242864 RepID=S9P8J0_CYSF2|nr:NAD/NADP octopine/nopaline dehydrogenase family protein [Cystobacter fuscus]EPX60760.1 NAD/NADP octopine/nopaline dehydrogenase [Cystobacter fuscus DSM 2262]
MGSERIGVIGSGNTARALAAYLSHQGHSVCVYTRHPEKLDTIRRRGHIEATGLLEGMFPIEEVTNEPERLARQCGTLFVASVTTAYLDVAATLAPHLREHHALVLFSSKLCGSLEMTRALHGHGVQGVPIIETDALFACRAREDHGIWIAGLKGWTFLACPQRSGTLSHGPLVRRFFPGLEDASNLVQRGLTDFGALAHAIVSLVNLGSIDRGERLRFYVEGLSERTIVLLERMEEEFHAVARAYGTSLLPMKELLNRYYGCETGSLLEAMRTVPGYRELYAPTSLEHRFLTEDIATSLVPLQGLARKAGVAVPMVDAVITFTSVLSGQDLGAKGRTLERLGWGDLSHEAIVQWMAQ